MAQAAAPKTETKVDSDSNKSGKLEDLKKFKNSRTPGLCASCGENATEASILVQVRKGKEHVASRSRTFCESCTVEAFQELADTLIEHSSR